ncbi:MAG: helix-turn-helix domain-containing protein, partial [Bacteroidota bacterium]
MPIGEKISALRKRKGISQELLAENSRTSLRTIQRIERGTTSPRPYTLKAIADALSVSVEEIAPGSPTKPGSEELTPLKFINSSALIVLVLPPMNILLPLLIWRKHKHLPTVDITGRKIISFQILWTISTIMILLGAQLLQLSITGSARVG